MMAESRDWTAWPRGRQGRGADRRRHPWRGRLSVVAAVLIWSATPIFQYWLAGPFDAWTQNFYRYAAGFFTMVPFLAWMAWRSPRGLTPSEWLGCAVAAVPNVVHQVCQTLAVVLLLPGVYALLGRMSVILTVVLAVIFFADERWIARSVKFQLGTVLALAGVAGLVWSPDAGEVSRPGLWLAVLAATGWACYGILVKKFTARAGATAGFGAISFFTALLLLPLMLAFGDGGAVFRTDAWTNVVLFGSGFLAIGVGHWLYYVGIRELGAAPAQSALLLGPLGTMLLSAAFFGETFRPGQLVAGAVLLGGAFLALAARPPVVEEPA
jgi:drug/metabolite transporter (DMT)-like permease